MKFDIENHNTSGIDIKSLRCIDWTDHTNDQLYGTYRPYRWIRKVTNSGSYVCRM